MNYTPTHWEVNTYITPEKLNNIEEGIVQLNNEISSSNFYQKKISIIGDSIEAFGGSIPSDYVSNYPDEESGIVLENQMWWKIVINTFDAKLLVNASYANSCVIKYNSVVPSFCDRTAILSSENKNPDIIFVALGTTDSNNNSPLTNTYNYNKELNELNESNFIDAYIKGIKQLKKNYKEAKIICIIKKMKKEYSDAIKKIATYYNLNYIDVNDYKLADFWYLPDTQGMRQIAERIILNGQKEILKNNAIEDSSFTLVCPPITQIADLLRLSESNISNNYQWACAFTFDNANNLYLLTNSNGDGTLTLLKFNNNFNLVATLPIKDNNIFINGHANDIIFIPGDNVGDGHLVIQLTGGYLGIVQTFNNAAPQFIRKLDTGIKNNIVCLGYNSAYKMTDSRTEEVLIIVTEKGYNTYIMPIFKITNETNDYGIFTSSKVYNAKILGSGYGQCIHLSNDCLYRLYSSSNGEESYITTENPLDGTLLSCVKIQSNIKNIPIANKTNGESYDAFRRGEIEGFYVDDIENKIYFVDEYGFLYRMPNPFDHNYKYRIIRNTIESDVKSNTFVTNIYSCDNTEHFTNWYINKLRPGLGTDDIQTYIPIRDEIGTNKIYKILVRVGYYWDSPDDRRSGYDNNYEWSQCIDFINMSGCRWINLKNRINSATLAIGFSRATIPNSSYPGLLMNKIIYTNSNGESEQWEYLKNGDNYDNIREKISLFKNTGYTLRFDIIDGEFFAINKASLVLSDLSNQINT